MVLASFSTELFISTLAKIISEPNGFAKYLRLNDKYGQNSTHLLPRVSSNTRGKEEQTI